MTMRRLIAFAGAGRAAAACSVATALLALLLLPVACTDPGLCYEDAHPHEAGVFINYNFPESYQLDPQNSDSMQVLAVRIINHQKRGMLVQALQPNHGRYFYNAPEDVEEWIDPASIPVPEEPVVDPGTIAIITDPEEVFNGGIGPEDPTPQPVAPPAAPKTSYEKEVDRFALSKGTYKFFTMSNDTSQIRYSNVGEYLDSPGDGTQASDIRVEYRSYPAGDSRLRKIGGDWTDYNPAFEFIQPEPRAIIADSLDITEIAEGQRNDVTFNPKPLTQHIDVYLTLKKVADGIPFVIDTVWAEISGIPSRAYLFSGHLYLAKTRKVRFNTEFIDANGNPKLDTTADDSVRVHGAIDVLTIMNPSGPDVMTGPGFLQLKIKAHARRTRDDGTVYERHVVMQSKTNLYKDLMDANGNPRLITYDPNWQWAVKSCDNAVLDISTEFIVYGTSILDKVYNPGGIDLWVESGSDEELEL